MNNYTVQDLINDLKQFNLAVKIINTVEIGWNIGNGDGKKEAEYIAINYNGDVE